MGKLINALKVSVLSVEVAAVAVFAAPVVAIGALIQKVYEKKTGRKLCEWDEMILYALTAAAVYCPVLLVIYVIALPINVVLFFWRLLFGDERKDIMNSVISNREYEQDKLERQKKAKALRDAVPEREKAIREKLMREINEK